MPIQFSCVLSQNITLVYDSLDLRAIGTSKLKEFIADARPMVMDTPEMLSLIHISEPTRPY